MNRLLKSFVLSITALITCSQASAQIVTTICGTGSASYGGDGGAAGSAYLDAPISVITDPSGNIYISDGTNNRIRKITISTGVITTVAGNGTAGFSGDGGAAVSAKLNTPSSVALDDTGNIYICDYLNNRIRKVNTSGIISTYAGNGTAGFSGDGGAATAAEINQPSRILWDGAGSLYIADRYNYRIRKVNTSGVISTFAGNGSSSYSGDGGAATSAGIYIPYSMIMDAAGNLYFCDLYDSRVRKINTSGIISTFAGNGSSSYSGDGGPATAAGVPGVEGLAIDPSGNIYIGDNTTGLGDDRIRKVDVSGNISLFAGTGTAGFSGDGGAATAAKFYLPGGVWYDGVNTCLYVADQFNNRVRKIAMNNHPPHFTGGISETISVCENSTSDDITTVLAVLDTDAGQTETWTVNTAPVNGSLGGFPGSITSTGTTVTPTGLSYTPTTGYSGADSFKITVSDGLAYDTITIYVTVNPLPATGTISGSATVCTGATTNYTESVTGGTWSSGASSIASVSSTGVVSGIAAGTAVISYTVTNSCGTLYATSTITVIATPTAGTITGPSSMCAVGAITVADATTGGTWSASNGHAIVTGTTVTGATAGIDTVLYTVTNSCGTAIATHAVTINPMPATITGTMAVCEGGSITTLGDTSTGGNWTSSAGSVATVDGSGNVTGVAAGTVTISYTFPTGCGVTTAVTVNPLPSTITGSSAVCQAATIILSNTSAGGNWTSSNTSVATIANTSSTTGTLTGVSNGTTIVTYTLGTGCIATKTITVNALPFAIGGPTAVCTGSLISLTDGSGGGTWSSSNTSQATVDASGQVTGVASGSPIITYTITGGCFITQGITVNPLPSAISGSTVVCTGLSTALSETGTGTWSSSNTSVATVTSATGVVTGVTAGTLTITYTLATTCFTTTAYTVNQTPTAISGPSAVCEAGSSISLSDSEPGGTWSSGSSATATVSASGIVTGVSAGTVAISYLISGCPATKSVTVNPLPGAIISPLGDTMLCPGDFVLLTANTGTSYTYQWFSGAGTISGETDEYYIAASNDNFKVQVTNAYGCISMAIPMAVSINPAVARDSTAGATTFCSGGMATLYANIGTGLSYQWLRDGAGIPGATASTYFAGTTGDFSVVVSNVAGCAATSSAITITTIAGPANTITLSGATTFCTGDSVIIMGDTTAGLTYQWTVAGTPISGATNVTYTATTTGNYQLIETNSYPCSSTSAVAVVNELPLPAVTVSAAGSTAFCTGGSVYLSAPTGAAGSTYQWYRNGTAIAGALTSNYTAVAGGNYAVNITAPTGCSNITRPAFAVTEVTTPVIIPYSSTTFCWGGSALLGVDVTATSGITYQWQFAGANIPGGTNSTYNATLSGDYSCIVTVAGGCTTAAVAVTVTELPLPNPIITFDGTALHTAGYYTLYQWYRNLIPIVGANSAVYVPNGIGDYTVKVVDSNGCQSVATEYILRSIQGADILNTATVQAIEVSIYPNPAQELVHIVAPVALTAVIHAVDGRTVLQQDHATEIDIHSLPDGTYFIQLYDKAGNLVKVDKLIKN